MVETQPDFDEIVTPCDIALSWSGKSPDCEETTALSRDTVFVSADDVASTAITIYLGSRRVTIAKRTIKSTMVTKKELRGQGSTVKTITQEVTRLDYLLCDGQVRLDDEVEAGRIPRSWAYDATQSKRLRRILDAQRIKGGQLAWIVDEQALRNERAKCEARPCRSRPTSRMRQKKQ